MSGRALPPWSRDEAVLAFAIAAARIGERVRVNDPDVLSLSDLLRSAAGRSDHRFRNPHGVARKIWTFAALLGGREAHPPSPLERRILIDFLSNPDGLDQWIMLAKAGLVAQTNTPSRGPVPSVGRFAVERRDKPSVVYAAMLDGARLASGAILVKIGMSNRVARRQRELNAGFPQALGIRWTVVRTWAFANSKEAYLAEQAIIQSEARRGRSVGSEFIRLEPGELSHFLDGWDAALARPQWRPRWEKDRRRSRRTSPSVRHSVKRWG